MSGQFNRIFGVDNAPASEAEGLHEEIEAESEAEVTISAVSDHPSTPRPSLTPSGEYMTHIGAGSCIEGKIICKGPTRIAGAVNGEIIADSLVVVDDGASVDADLSAEEAIIGGRINGNVIAQSRISLSATARIEGDIQTPSLTIEEGAVVKGKVDVAPNPAKMNPVARTIMPSAAPSEMGFARAGGTDAPFPS